MTQLDHRHHKETHSRYCLSLLLHDLDVASNVGSVFRLADALGIEKLYLTGRTAAPPNRKLKKSARSTEKYVPYTFHNTANDIVASLKHEGYIIIALEITAKSIDLHTFTPASDAKICLILGSENTGISQELLHMCDHTLHIPMLGINSSMNVASACAIACYELTKKLDIKNE